MNKPDFTAALMNAWHLQPLGMRDDRRLQAVIDAAWAMRTVAPPTEKVLDEAVACARYYSNVVRDGVKRVARHEISRNTYSTMAANAENRIRDRVAAAIK